MTAKPETKAEIPQSVRTPEAILSYPHLFEPQAFTGEDGKVTKMQYSACLIFTPEAQQTPEFKAMRAAVTALLRDRWGEGLTVGKKKYTLEQALKQGLIVTPFRNNWEEKGYPEGSIYINVTKQEKYGPPQVVSIYPDKDGRPTPVTDQALVYPGVIVMATVRPYAWDYQSMKRGVSFGMGNFQIRRDGERLDSNRDARDEFQSDPDAAAQLEQLTETAAGAPNTTDELPDDLAGLLG
jgi:hypothetical protein